MRHYIEEHGKYICYDLLVKSNLKVILFKDNSLNTSITGQLRDDYYFGNILIYNDIFNYTIKADNKWIIDEINYYYDNKKLMIRYLGENECIIRIRNSEFLIKKIKNIYGLSFLNFLINELNYDNIGGIIGDIASKKYIFYENVQENLKGAISINGKLFDAQIIEKEQSSCWHITPKAAFYPKKLDDYVII